MQGQEIVSCQGHEEYVQCSKSIAVRDVHVQKQSTSKRNTEQGLEGIQDAVVGQKGCSGRSEARAGGHGSQDQEVAKSTDHSHGQQHCPFYLCCCVAVHCGIARLLGAFKEQSVTHLHFDFDVKVLKTSSASMYFSWPIQLFIESTDKRVLVFLFSVQLCGSV